MQAKQDTRYMWLHFKFTPYMDKTDMLSWESVKNPQRLSRAQSTWEFPKISSASYFNLKNNF